MPLIVEGLLTTAHQGRVNLAPMGPLVEPHGRRIVLRPFPGSKTCDNLLATRQAVFHVTDDVELLARAAIGAADPLPDLLPCAAITGWILADACRWFALRVREVDDTPPRFTLTCDVVEQGERRPFLGLNRAKHAVVEAAILATRRHLLPRDEIQAELHRLRPLVEKTGGAAECRAWELLTNYLESPSADG